MPDPIEDFEAFKARYIQVVGSPLAPWQEQLIERLARGSHMPAMVRPRRSGMDMVILLRCAISEIKCERYEVVGLRAAEIRREARELAARLTEVQP